MTSRRRPGPRRLRPRRVRDLQRAAHLSAGLLLVVYVYAAPQLGPGPTAVARWVVAPALVLSGLALWKWHRLRAALRPGKELRGVR